MTLPPPVSRGKPVSDRIFARQANQSSDGSARLSLYWPHPTLPMPGPWPPSKPQRPSPTCGSCPSPQPPAFALVYTNWERCHSSVHPSVRPRTHPSTCPPALSFSPPLPSACRALGRDCPVPSASRRSGGGAPLPKKRRRGPYITVTTSSL